MTDYKNLVFHKNKCRRRYKFIFLGRNKSYFVKTKRSDSTKVFFEVDIIKMLDLSGDRHWLHR